MIGKMIGKFWRFIKSTLLAALEKLRDPKMVGVFRHLLSSIGSALVTYGAVTSAQVEAIVGGIMALLAFVLSWTAKEKSEGDK